MQVSCRALLLAILLSSMVSAQEHIDDKAHIQRAASAAGLMFRSIGVQTAAVSYLEWPCSCF